MVSLCVVFHVCLFACFVFIVSLVVHVVFVCLISCVIVCFSCVLWLSCAFCQVRVAVVSRLCFVCAFVIVMFVFAHACFFLNDFLCNVIVNLLLCV